MATKMMVKRFKGPKFSLDLPMAGLAALSVAFVAYAMPDALFGEAVMGSGLPALLPAAEPPLGTTARTAVIAVGASGTFLFIWLVLRALGGRPAPAKRRIPPLETYTEAPRLRRADAHPDAPSRRPLFAGLDLGEPADEGLELEAWELPPAPLEAFEPADASPIVEEPPETEECASPPPLELELEQPSIAHLMQRLELGIIRRQRHVPGAAEAAPAEQDGVAAIDETIDQRLRTALQSLQQMTSRNA